MWKLTVSFCCLIILLGHIELSNSSIAVCITNCVQCKQMFGKYFHGGACGDSCILTNGRETPDCSNPGTIRNFLKRAII